MLISGPQIRFEEKDKIISEEKRNPSKHRLRGGLDSFDKAAIFSLISINKSQRMQQITQDSKSGNSLAHLKNAEQSTMDMLSFFEQTLQKISKGKPLQDFQADVHGMHHSYIQIIQSIEAIELPEAGEHCETECVDDVLEKQEEELMERHKKAVGDYQSARERAKAWKAQINSVINKVLS